MINGVRHHFQHPTSKMVADPISLNASQIVSDFLRDQYSADDGFPTLRLPNTVVLEEAIRLAGTIKKVLKLGKLHKK
jgi:very-short-patch-repair endonuclease